MIIVSLNIYPLKIQRTFIIQWIMKKNKKFIKKKRKLKIVKKTQEIN